MIADLAECHSYYVQQLAQQCWLRTSRECLEETVYKAHEGIVDQLSLLFQAKIEELTIYQINFLKALLKGAKQFSSKETMEQYNLGTSANVVRIKKTLENREIIDIRGSDINLLDPMYKSWLESRYFKLKK